VGYELTPLQNSIGNFVNLIGAMVVGSQYNRQKTLMDTVLPNNQGPHFFHKGERPLNRGTIQGGVQAKEVGRVMVTGQSNKGGPVNSGNPKSYTCFFGR